MDLLAELNDPQRQAVMHVDGPLLVLAGAGSGKTRVITRRVAWLIEQGIYPGRVLAITFTNKAAGEMRERAAALGTPPGATLCTFHALCARLLREFADCVHLTPNYTIYDRDDQLRLVKQALADLRIEQAGLTPATLHATISNAKNALTTPDALAEEAASTYMKTATDVYRRYEELLSANNALDFDDLLLRMAYLLRDRPDVRQCLADRYQYVLIDEYQDTNHAQYVIAHAIAGQHENLCVTGDPDQSIYAWRGANIRNILEFERDYPNAAVVRLEENYRSSGAILAAASSLIRHNTHRKDKSLWTQRQSGPDVRVLLCDNEHSESREVVRRISAARDAGRAWGDIAVFYRVNSLSRLLEEALLRAGIAYRVARGVEFYNRKEIKDVLAYLRLVANPEDDLSCHRVINTPTRGIGATTVKRLDGFAAAKGIGLLDACRRADQSGLGKAAAAKVRAFAAIIDSVSAELDQPVQAVMRAIIERSGMENVLHDGGEETAQARENVGELINAAADFDATVGAEAATASVADFLHQIALVSDVDSLDQSAGFVTLMTLHAAKGLEFPVVFIVGCEEGLLPFQRAGNNRFGAAATYNVADLEEERRLAFVGMTRAKDELTLSSAVERMIRGRTERQVTSAFLSEIGTDRVTHVDLTSEVAYAPRRRPASGGGFYADSAQREAIEAMSDTDDALHYDPCDDDSMPEDFPPEYEHLAPGCTVRHRQFGTGIVKRISERWPNTKAVIDFYDRGRKTIILRKAQMEVLGG